MNEQTRNKMLKDYGQLEFKGKSSCIKYWYTYNNVNVNLYFDAYDEDAMLLTLILNANGQFYLTTLNIINTKIQKHYLLKLPPAFYAILVDGNLNSFYEYMQDRILNLNPYPTSYQHDTIFATTLKRQINNIDLPFWSQIKEVRMSDDMLLQLKEHTNIPVNILYQLKNSGYTLARTVDCSKRRKLKSMLKEKGVIMR